MPLIKKVSKPKLSSVDSGSPEELAELLRIVSHDLQSPLKNIGLMSELLKQRGVGRFDEKDQELLGFIQTASKHASELATGFLRYLRATGSFQKREKIFMDKIADDLIRDLDPQIQEAGASISIKKIPPITADSLQVRELLKSLVENSIKFRSHRPLMIEFSARKKSNKWIFAVIDNGIGIDKKYEESIFEIFRKVSVGAHAGAGIGLAIAKKIVSLHGGDIWVQSKPGVGSSFFFTLSPR